MDKLKINVGCGPYDHKEGWINVDIQNFKSVDVVMDVTKAWKFENVDFIFAEHFIEHLRLEQGVVFLYNAYNSLHSGGVMRLSTPNIEHVLQTHYKFEDRTHAGLLNSVFAVNRGFYGWGHNFLYSEHLLKYIMRVIGFEDVKICEYGKSEFPELNGLEQHGKPSSYKGYPNFVIVEGAKSQQRPVAVLNDEFMSTLHESFFKYNNAK